MLKSFLYKTGRKQHLDLVESNGIIGEQTMANNAFEDIVEDFTFLDDWEDRYRYVIEQGKSMSPPQAL